VSQRKGQRSLAVASALGVITLDLRVGSRILITSLILVIGRILKMIPKHSHL
jgi:hypothetical protein